jgi:hypothetical protein
VLINNSRIANSTRQTFSGKNSGLYVLIFLLYFAYRLKLTQGHDLEIFVDSARYLPGSKEVAGFVNPDLFTEAVYSILRSHGLIYISQNAFSIFAWAFLAHTLMKIVKPDLLAYVSAILILLFSCGKEIVSWNHAALTESFSLSLIVLFFACILRQSETPITWTFLVAALNVLANPKIIVVIVPVLIVNLIRFIKTRCTKAILGIVYLLLLTFFALFRLSGTAFNTKMKYWYAMNNFAERSEFRFWLIRQSGQCSTLEHENLWKMIDQQALRDTLKFVNKDIYILLHKDTIVIEWFFSQPLVVLKMFLRTIVNYELLMITNTPSLYDLGLTANFVYLVMIASICGAGIGIFAQIKVDSVNVSVFALFNLFALFAFWISDGMEENRHILVPSIMSILTCFFLSILLTNKVKGSKSYLTKIKPK